MTEWGRAPGPDTYPDLMPSIPYPDPDWDEIRRIAARAMHYGLDAQPISRREWVATHEDFERRLINRTTIGEGITVSTVWVGLDMSFFSGPPLMFETMVFVDLDEPRENPWFNRPITAEGTECHRWPSIDAARAGHDQIVADLSAQLPGADVESLR